MTGTETYDVINLLRVAYPQSYRGKTQEDVDNMVKIYHTLLSDLPIEVVMVAVKEHILHCKFPPAISEIMERVDAMRKDAGGTDYEALFAELWAGICGNKIFDELSEPNKAYIQNQQALNDMGLSEDTIQGVVKGQYMKRIPAIVERLQTRAAANAVLGEANLQKLLGGEADANRRLTEEVPETGRGEAGEAKKLPF